MRFRAPGSSGRDALKRLPVAQWDRTVPGEDGALRFHHLRWGKPVCQGCNCLAARAVNRPHLEQAADFEHTVNRGACLKLETHPGPVFRGEQLLVDKGEDDRRIDEFGLAQIDDDHCALLEKASERVLDLGCRGEVVFS